jgi:hypothetical protein
MTVTTLDSNVDPRARAAYALSRQHQLTQAQVRAQIVAGVLGIWATVNSEQLLASWTSGVLERIFSLVSLGQYTVASQARSFVKETLSVQGAEVDIPEIDPFRFAGISSDGQSLDSLLTGAVAHTFERLGRGDSSAAALKAGADFLTLATSTQISDAGRAADQVAITAAEPTSPDFEAAGPAPTEPKKLRYGWVRMLTPPSCSRCAILAGQFYKWNDGFLRHPMCDCRHIPAIEAVALDVETDADEYFNSLTREEQNKYFGVANSRAIRDGADIYQVVNATTRKGAMFTADRGRRYTTEGTTRRGFAYVRMREAKRKGKVLRPTPWQLYKDAKGNREDAIEFLRRFGYIL